jgi:receptor expression-enhancing protein 5/6
MVPTSWNGSIVIYYRLIRPFVLRHQDRVDKALSQAAEVAGDALNEGENQIHENSQIGPRLVFSRSTA